MDSASENPPLASTAPTFASSDLVDRDFRGKFVDTKNKLNSSTNLAGLDRMRKTASVVRFADEMPHDLRKGKGREILPPLGDENAGSSRLRTIMTTATMSDDEGDDEGEGQEEGDGNEGSWSDHMKLPRTKSQLSLLIQIKRDETGSADLGPPPKPQGTKGKEKEKRKAQTKEEELLSMGRKGGVTKAGGVQVPRQQRVSEHDDPGQFSASSPEPLF